MWVIRLLFVGGLVLLATGRAHGGLVVYTNRAAWESAVSYFAQFDVDMESPDTFTSQDFGDFTASKTDPNLVIGIRDGSQSTNVNATNHFYFTTTANTQSPLSLTFDSPISAFGLDWKTIDSQDGLDIVINGMLFNVSPNGTNTGFFGVVDDMGGLFTVVNLQDDNDVGSGGINIGVGFDNLVYGSALGAAVVPEGSSLTLWGIVAVVGTIGATWRRRSQRSNIA